MAAIVYQGRLLQIYSTCHQPSLQFLSICCHICGGLPSTGHLPNDRQSIVILCSHTLLADLPYAACSMGNVQAKVLTEHMTEHLWAPDTSLLQLSILKVLPPPSTLQSKISKPCIARYTGTIRILQMLLIARRAKCMPTCLLFLLFMMVAKCAHFLVPYCATRRLSISSSWTALRAQHCNRLQSSAVKAQHIQQTSSDRKE